MISFFGASFGGASLLVGVGAGVPAQAAEGDAVERGVGLAVAAAVEAVSVGASGAGGQGRDAAERGEGGFGDESVGVLAGGDQDLPGDVGSDAGQGEQGGVDGAHERFDQCVQLGDLG